MSLEAAQIPNASTGVGLIALAVAAVIVVALIVWHRRNPSDFAKNMVALEAAAKADATALGHKALDLARNALTKVPAVVQAPAPLAANSPIHAVAAAQFDAIVAAKAADAQAMVQANGPISGVANQVTPVV